MTIFSMLPALLLAGQAATAPQGESAQPVVQIGVYGYRADGTVSGFAVGDSSSLESTVYTTASLCGMGAGFREPPAMAAYAWRFSGKILSMTPDLAVVQVDWQRVMDQGNDVAAARQSVQLSLRPGDRVLLDSVAPQTVTCSVTNAGFEARYVSRDQRNGAQAGGGRGGRIAGSGYSRGDGGGGVGASAGSAAIGGGGRSANGRAVAFVPPADPADPDLLNVELWLVHTAPGREEEALYQSLRSSREGANFAFAPVSIPAAEGSIVVQVTGSFAFGTPSDPRLVFMTNRRVSFNAAAGQARDRAPETWGSSRIAQAMPGPDDVLSFELPPLAASNGRPAIADRFAVRVRVRSWTGRD